MAKILSLLSLSILLGCVAYQILCLPYALLEAATSRMDAWELSISKGMGARDRQVAAILDKVDGYLSMDELQANVMSTNFILNKVAQIVTKVNNELIPQVETLLSSSNSLVQDMQKDLDSLTGDTEKTLLPLKETLQNIASLTKDLDSQVKEGGPAVKQTTDALTKSLNDLDALLADPDIQRTMANVERGTGSLANAADTVDKVMLPWRQRVGRLKFILGKALSLIHVVAPLPGL